jgi:LemA protein
MYSRKALVVGAVVLSGCLLYGWRTHRELVDAEHFLDVAHGRLLVQIQRRHDLLGTCRTVVARYAATEEQIQEHLITLQGLTKVHGPQAPQVQREGMELLALVEEVDLLIEAYPDLKSKGPYVLLMETIQETGLRVVTERLNTNTITYNYNVMRRLFPQRIVAMVFGFEERPFVQGRLEYAPLDRVF